MSTDDIIGTAYRQMAQALLPSGAASAVLDRRVAQHCRRTIAFGAGVSVLAMAGVAYGVSLAIDQEADAVDPKSPVFASEATLPSTLESEFDWQTAIASYKDELVRVAEQDQQFAGAELRFNERAIILYGKGDPSGELTEVIARAPEGTVARWVRVPYSAADLLEAERQLMEGLPRISRVTFAPDYDGLVVGIDGLPKSESGMEELRSLAAAITDVPMTFEDQSLAVPAPLPAD